MASTYSTDLKLELMATGENAGTWGTKTNTNLNLIQQAIAGFQSIDVAATNVTLDMLDASISNARNMVLKFTGTLAGNRTVSLPDGIEKFYILQDATTHGANSLTFKTTSGTGFTLTESKMHGGFSDGTNAYEVALNTLGGTIGTLQLADDAVTSAKVADNAILTANISDNQISSAKIIDSNITTAKLDNNAVTTLKINNDAVTAAKLERKFTISTAAPSGGSDGDIWFKYS
jgi:hypothetical protein